MPAPEEELIYWIPAHARSCRATSSWGRPGPAFGSLPRTGTQTPTTSGRWYAGGLRSRLDRLVDMAPRMVLVAHGEPVRAGGAAALRAALDAVPDRPS